MIVNKRITSKQQGFTLIELLFALGIAAILLNIGLPSFQTLLENSKMTAEINQLRGTLQLARESAITQNKKVTICPSEDGLTCSTNWSDGYISFIDDNSDRKNNGSDELIVQYKNTDSDLILRWRAFGVKSSFQWHQTGITNYQNGTFEYCNQKNPELARALFISKSGNIRVSKDTNGDGIHENTSGKNISC